MTEEEYQIEVRKLNLRQKQLEIEKIQVDSKKRNITNPVIGTIIVALLGLFGTFITNSLQKNASLEIEQQKFQFEIYSKAQSAESPEKAAQILDFYIKAKLIPGEEGEFTELVKDGELDKVPILSDDAKSLKEVYGDITIPSSNEESFQIENHFLIGRNVNQILSPNTSGEFDTGYPDAIIFNYTAGHSKEMAVKYLTKSSAKASAHFIIGKDGSITQIVPLNYSAWGVGMSKYDDRTSWNKYSIQIEFVNVGVLTKQGDDYKSLFNKTYQEDEVYYGNHKHETTPKYWGKYTEAQILSAEKLCKILLDNYNIKYVLGHDDISKGKKRDPGPAFPLKRFQDMLE